ncbi:hypothetical protein [Methylobacterium thuringiense]|uniref:Head decoration protein n=1 Tax=Methylobacterium thuringiense TaxID=1003091 RepID=A0ABQ4TL97_9HYPH|nr:hypothetical protein [Methylobacterium thuringiense]GJE54593.1 hypothetical protein EKPJFOCH_1071 [Methylobacterium thuringiense]
MANAVYPKFKEALIQGSTNSSLGGTVKVALVDTGTYTYSAAHQFLTDLTGVVGTAQTLANKTYVGGLLDADDVTFSAVTGASVEALVLYIDTGTAGTSRLVAFEDAGVTGLPVTPNGGDIPVVWNASGIIQF